MASAICLLPRLLKRDMVGNDVYAMKRALSRAGYGRGILITRKFGATALKRLVEFQTDMGIMVDGEYGMQTHKKLAPYYDAYGMKLMNDMYHRLHDAPTAVEKMVSAALEIYNYCKLTGLGTYTQSGLRMSIIRNRWRIPFRKGTHLYEDCSSSCKGICWEAGIPTPDGIPYEMCEGYTGTISLHGFRVSVPVLGAFGFYGSGHPYKHMTMCVRIEKSGLAYVFSWGSGLPKILPYNYRSDFNHWRSGYAVGK